MKKPSKSGTPAKKSAPTRTERNQRDPILDKLGNLDPEMIALMLQVIESEAGAGLGAFAASDPVGTFKEYLAHCKNDSLEQAEAEDLLGELVSQLTVLRVDADGDPDAREAIHTI